MSTQPSQKPGWHKILNDLNLTASACEPPPGRSSATADTSQTTWLLALACFARTGFLRVLLGETPAHLELYIQIATGSALQTPELLTAALASHTQTPWTAHVTSAPFELSTVLPTPPEHAETTQSALRDVLVALMKVCELISSDSTQLTPEMIASTLSFTPATTKEKPPEDATPTEDTFFETIGLPTHPETQKAPDIERFEVKQHDKTIEITLHLTTLLRPSEHSELANALAHHLRARFDANVLPASSALSPTTPDFKSSTIQLDADASEENQRTPTGHAELAKNFTAFFKKAQEWAALGIDIFELVGLKHANSTPDAIHFTTTQADKHASPPPEKTPAASTSDDIVFDLSSRPSPRTNADTSSTLTFSNSNADVLIRGNFTDERLNRGDAVTPLVDLVLRHPGYSDRRIGQVLSIILSIDYHAALRLVENAPCVIAWGLAQQTASNYKDVIETTGGKALLVEPDTFRER